MGKTYTNYDLSKDKEDSGLDVEVDVLDPLLDIEARAELIDPRLVSVPDDFVLVASRVEVAILCDVIEVTDGMEATSLVTGFEVFHSEVLRYFRSRTVNDDEINFSHIYFILYMIEHKRNSQWVSIQPLFLLFERCIFLIKPFFLSGLVFYLQ